jgi:ABC-2 type transport system ATP-binding protein
MAAPRMIEVQHLTKDYGTVVAVQDVSFRVGNGEIVGFLGPNGAGKSTTLRVLAGFLGPTSGRVRIAGKDIAEDPLGARRAIGYMPENAPLYPEMRVTEYLLFRARLKEVPRARRRTALGSAMERAGVTHMAETPIAHLSKGYRQRVALADALVADPPLLILDEPTAGLDPNQIREVRALIKSLAETHTVLLSTHILSEVEATCQRALVIDRGRLVAEGRIAELLAQKSQAGLSIRVRDLEDRAVAVVSALARVHSVEARSIEGAPSHHLELCIELDRELERREPIVEQIVRALSLAEVGIHSVVPTKASLEEVFSELTRHDPIVAAPAVAKKSE